MGGPGSGRWPQGHERKTAVEECFLLDIHKLKPSLLGLPHEGYTGYCWSIKISEGKFKCIDYEVDPHGGADGDPLVKLTYNLDTIPSQDEPVGKLFRDLVFGGLPSPTVELSVELTSTEPAFGGKRWWFACPLRTEEGQVCARRVAKLWLPRGERFFGCTKCHDLTHKSSQECHDFDRFLRQLGECVPEGTSDVMKNLMLAYTKAQFLGAKAEGRRRKENKKHIDEMLSDMERAFGKD